MSTQENPAPASVRAQINYVARNTARPRYHANDMSRDFVPLAPEVMAIENARLWPQAASLDREGFALLRHVSAVPDFRDEAATAAIHVREIQDFLMNISGADEVSVRGRPILRFSEADASSGKLDNSRPARFAHVDMSDATARQFVEGDAKGRTLLRYCYYNVWRTFSAPPQDVPLAICDARSVLPEDLLSADAVFDAPGQPEWSFEGLVAAHNPDHRWAYFHGMTRDEVIVFKTHDSDAGRAHSVPHVAFDDPSCPAGVPPRASVEMRGTALWFA